LWAEKLIQSQNLAFDLGNIKEEFFTKGKKAEE